MNYHEVSQTAVAIDQALDAVIAAEYGDEKIAIIRYNTDKDTPAIAAMRKQKYTWDEIKSEKAAEMRGDNVTS